MLQPRDTAPALALFGGPEMRTADGAPIRLTPTHEALLSLVWGQEHSGLTRRRAIWLLWEDDDAPPSRHRLSQVLHEIRTRVGVDPIALCGEDTLLPAWDAVRSDVTEYAAALESGSLQKALVMEGRGFAGRLRRIPGEEFDDWLTAKRTGLRRDLREIAARTWDEHQPRGSWRAAREAAEVLHVLDPGNEAALRKVLEARAMTGGFEAAEAAFAAHVEAVGDETPVEAETRALVERIRRLVGNRELGPPRDTAPPPPLVGRAKDLETARGVLDRVRRGGFEFLLLRGESGVGKTRLLEEVRKEAHIKGFRCLQARPVELEQRIPLSPLIDALAHPEAERHICELEEPWRAVIAALLPQLPPGMERTEVPPIAESSLSRRLYDAFGMLLTRLAEDEPTLVFIDDLQWADATTVTTLQFVQRRWRTGSLGVICTVRPDLVTGSEGVAKYLMGADDLPVTSISVDELDDASARTLVEQVADGSLDAPVVRRLCALGGRNPFYLIELTKDLLAGHLQLPELPSHALIVPISLRQLMDPRIDALSAPAAQALSLLSIWGRWARLSDLAALTREPLDECIMRVEELERHRLVVLDRDQVRITHELFRGAVYHRLSEARRAVLHRIVAEYLLSLDQPHVGELAGHFGRAGDSEKAALFGRQAADTALENGAMAEAAHFLQVVLDNEQDAVMKAEATADLARVLHMGRDMARANPLLAVAAERLRAVGRSQRALRMDIRQVEGLAELGVVSTEELLRRLASIKTTARATQDDEAWALALDTQLHLLDRAGRVDEMQKLFVEIRQCASSTNPGAACRAYAALAVNVFFTDGGEALQSARRAVDLAHKHDLNHYLFLAQMRHFVVLFAKGLSRSAEAKALLSCAGQIADRSGDIDLRFQFAANVGVAEMDAGCFVAATSHFARAGEILSHGDNSIARCQLQCNLGELAFLTSDFDSVLAHYRAAERILQQVNGATTLSLMVATGIGLGALETGDLAEARRRGAETLPIPDEWHFDPFIFLCFHARLLERRGRGRGAVNLLQHHAMALIDRLPNAALKLTVAEVQMSRRTRVPDWQTRAAAGIRLAERLGFVVWADELTRLLVLPTRTS